MEMEELMINRLKEVCGYEFTSKLHSMFTDVRLSAEHTKKFHDSVTGSKNGLSMNMSVNILQVKKVFPGSEKTWVSGFYGFFGF